MILPIYLYGSEVLRRENVDVDLNDKEGILKLIEDMKETLKAADGCGLAAPQVGVNKNIVIVDGRDLTESYEYLHDFFRVIYNDLVVYFFPDGLYSAENGGYSAPVPVQVFHSNKVVGMDSHSFVYFRNYVLGVSGVKCALN